MARDRSAERKHDYDAICEDHESGMTYVEIAQKHGCGMTTVHSAIQRMSRLDPAIEAALTEAFRKVMGFCPIADGASRPE